MTLDRAEDVTPELTHGTAPIEIRHKHDGCWELYQESDDGGAISPDIIHIEQEDMPEFLAALFKATGYARPAVADITIEERPPGAPGGPGRTVTRAAVMVGAAGVMWSGEVPNSAGHPIPLCITIQVRESS